LGQFFIEDARDWEGDAEALARTVAFWARRLRHEDTSELTVRLIRDYAQRGILERPRREGKIALDGWDHLVQLLAARKLLSEGWPLQKIAELFLVSSSPRLLDGRDPGTAARPGVSPDSGEGGSGVSELRRILRKAGSETYQPESASADRVPNSSRAPLTAGRVAITVPIKATRFCSFGKRNA
jgi:hypothetical protein